MMALSDGVWETLIGSVCTLISTCFLAYLANRNKLSSEKRSAETNRRITSVGTIALETERKVDATARAGVDSVVHTNKDVVLESKQM